jgi:hypothetical protein
MGSISNEATGFVKWPNALWLLGQLNLKHKLLLEIFNWGGGGGGEKVPRAGGEKQTIFVPTAEAIW